ncbi:MAG: cysteine--tRNA ligase [Candidatus Omnitrophica bacterium]|nr:cysteine--tRNA ligase [Candidatus Omnitrophota bacterium]
MGIQIYNSLTRKKEQLVPISGNTINMYSCGVTVYDKCHIGHARSLYVFEVIKNYLKYRGFKVNFIRNITDIDDKIIKKANDLGKSFGDVVKENIELYRKDLDSLGISRADFEPRATENIEEMISYIRSLIEKGYAYESAGDVYFSVRKFEGYGKLSGQSIEKMLEAVRIDHDPKKKDSLDFALWKKSKEGEPFWNSPWGDGRPGWHIECSVMSMKYLKCDTLDIHAGGRDLIFPHHENEITQSESLTGKPFAKYWIHHGLLTINGQKMAKSLGNFITIEDAIKIHRPEDLKMFFLLSHYGSPIDYSAEKIEEAHKALSRFTIFLEGSGESSVANSLKEPVSLGEFKEKFLVAMDDDFNTPKALGVINELITEVNKKEKFPSFKEEKAQAQSFIKEVLTSVFSLRVAMTKETIDSAIEEILNARAQARKDKDFSRSDELRDKLKSMGIIVEDGKDGQKWRKA